MSAAPIFEDYLTSKKIDSEAFRKSEPQVWQAWKIDFDQTHPNSFTVQKLNLINPIRRKYLLSIPVEIKIAENPLPVTNPSPAPSTAKPGKPMMGKPVMAKPVIKPKPDTDKSTDINPD